MTQREKIEELFGDQMQYDYIYNMEEIVESGIDDLKTMDMDDISLKSCSRINKLTDTCFKMIKQYEIDVMEKLVIWSPCVMKKSGFSESYVGCPAFKDDSGDPEILISYPFALYDNNAKVFYWLDETSENMRFTTIGRNMEFFSYDAITEVKDINMAATIAMIFRLAWTNHGYQYEYRGSGTEKMKTYGMKWIYKEFDSGYCVTLFFLIDSGKEYVADQDKLNEAISTISFSDPTDKFYYGYPFASDEEKLIIIGKTDCESKSESKPETSESHKPNVENKEDNKDKKDKECNKETKI